MELAELLKYNKITIQCHDNPDADAIASGWGLYLYLKENGKDVDFMYSGHFQITKANLKIMLEDLEIPIEYRRDNTEKLDGLLITVDCQYGALNVTKFQADDVMIIDHHQLEIDGIEKTYINNTMGSCSTIIWKYLCEAGFDLDKYPMLQTAFYYGLYSDTGQFSGISNPIDKDMMDSLFFNEPIMYKLQNSNISVRELEIAGVAMIRNIVNSELRFCVVKAEPCDPNILGLISDIVLQVSEIDYCVVFTVFDYGIKFSVRSCIKEAKANHIANYISKGIGSGGGHLYKAGGFIGNKEYHEQYGEYDYVTYFTNKLKEYKTGYEIIDTKDYVYDISDAKSYSKKTLRVGYVKATDILPVGEEVTVRTLEGDLHIHVTEDTYIMIGIKGEIYPIKEAKFNAGYRKCDEPYDLTLEYHPKAKLNATGASYDLLKHARCCYTTGTSRIYAKQLTRGAKIFTEWDRECYMLGEIGDYIACRFDDPTDVYIVEKDIFGLTYQED